MTAPCGCNCCEACLTAEIQRGQLEAVRMLDEWVKAGRGRGYYVVHGLEGGFVCIVTTTDSRRELRGDSPEAARGNAAEAVRAEL